MSKEQTPEQVATLERRKAAKARVEVLDGQIKEAQAVIDAANKDALDARQRAIEAHVARDSLMAERQALLTPLATLPSAEVDEDGGDLTASS